MTLYASLKPTVPKIINRIDTILSRLTDSCRKTIPIMLIKNIPNAPKIAYATPISIVLREHKIKTKNKAHKTQLR